ncbi:hypothetical protein Q8W37_04165 [Shimia thalassica]|jgi:hypothetical protein|uniref:Uncharacterized protein n=1 Tax=Shimia thalassica TaxID=1715693 RepID=A0A0P1IC90_9RHOB|nr:hypothetical protein [Shimia thalassica]MBU2943533.1 hypothetical protein [Shimia thalassica]MDO6478664.1 hypothetical protein [Shimia thalassica]MDO6484612.1 hypothetical protein [Shimia thalassica]MDO6501603.1 hypothetical protein [Shimia thalassica]MDO6521755.1 hypothetical protein [Shimia thalassica]
MAYLAQKQGNTSVALKPFVALAAFWASLAHSKPVPHWCDYLSGRDDR